MRFFVIVFALFSAVIAGAIAYGIGANEFWQGVVFGGTFIGTMWAWEDA
jgi:hypothetical protein